MMRKAGLAIGLGVACALQSMPTRADDAEIARGKYVFGATGGCGCHTVPKGQPNAGGRKYEGPFGTVYSTNITPDRETGIGDWSREAFARAMREGVRKDGAHLYPAFPYDRFTRTSDEDIDALYAYFMSIPAVRYEPPGNRLVFPFNVRAGIALWKARYFKPATPVRAVGGTPMQRGEYLVEGLGHCGSCHSPRTPLQAEDKDRLYDGGESEGWHAYAINAKNAAPIPWDVAALTHYLRYGWHEHHGIARGTMGLVTHELSAAAPEDIAAMATYTLSLMKQPSTQRVARGRELVRDPKVEVPKGTNHPGARIYAQVCRGCHQGGAGRDLPWEGMPLSWSIGVAGESPRNLVNVILHGIPPAPNGETTPVMPGYQGALDDAQVEALVTWMRSSLTDRPPWTGVREHIAKSRKMTPETLMWPPGGTGSRP